MLSPATRLAYLNAPTQIGFLEKSAPSFASCVRDMIIALTLESTRSIGKNGLLRWMTTVCGPAALMRSMYEKSLSCDEVGRVCARRNDVTTDCASNGVPSLNRIPLRSRIV